MAPCPLFALFHITPNYSHLLFGCLCYPNLAFIMTHKLAPRSAPCVFLGYSSTHKGYRCMDIATGRIIISRHVVFDETNYPFAKTETVSSSSYDFLQYSTPITAPAVQITPAVHKPAGSHLPAGSAPPTAPAPVLVRPATAPPAGPPPPAYATSDKAACR